jgi:hypothetical protein
MKPAELPLMAIKDLQLVPPGGWRYVQPESGALIRGGDYHRLLANIRDHRISNNYPIGLNFEAEIQNAICERGAECQPAVRDPGPRNVTLDDLRNFLLVLRKWVADGATFVSKEEAERRAAICVRCPRNQKVGGCFGCKGIVNLISEVIGGRDTRFDQELSGCGVCGCELRTAVHIPLEVQWRGVDDEMNEQFPDYCWKKRPSQVAAADEPQDNADAEQVAKD